jgi:hypothetical protein
MRREGGALSTVGKLLGNGLYGKFGSRPVHDEWMLSRVRPGPEWVPPAFDALDDDAGDAHDWLWTRTDAKLTAPYLLPHWAAWITAGARLRLLGLVESVGGRVLYADTDSVTVPAATVDTATAAGRLIIGAGFGECKIERRWSRFRALGPKVVQGVDADPCPPDCKVHPGGGAFHAIYKAKGIPRDQVAAAFDPDRPSVEWDSANGSLRVLRGADMLTHRNRRLSDLANSYAWQVADGEIRPIHLGD